MPRSSAGFATWHVLPKLRSRVERKPLTPAGRSFAGEQVNRATTFLGWLAARGLELADWSAGVGHRRRSAAAGCRPSVGFQRTAMR